ncbi:MAG TPA: FAD-linked oxidase C-terminal domain-containing protein, partial [Pirellulales bacterium]
MTAALAPAPSDANLAALVEELRAALGREAVLASREEMLVYECDGFTIEKNTPDVVVFPRSTQDVSTIVKLANQHRVPLLPRGAGTSLSGGALAVGGGVMIVLMRMNKIEQIDLRNRCALVEAGVVNIKLTQALKGTGYHYAPDPSSQGACSIGGNIATNSGGPHTLAYGVTVNHVLGVEVVLADGSVVWFGGPTSDKLGIDLVGLFVGCEGTFGICTRAWVRLTPDPHAFRTLRVIFETMDDAAEAITDIIAAGIIPAALEMMDGGVLEALEGAFHYGFPLDAEAMLIIEVDGIEAGLDELRDRVAEICHKHHAREVKQALTTEDRLKLWKCRKQAFGAIGRLSSSYCTQDGVVPRTKLPHILRTVRAVSAKYKLRIVNVFHAGDGNIHPIVLFDERDAEQVQRVLDASAEILDECLALGGSVTGEHGIGVEKIAYMSRIFDENTL